MRDSRIDPYTGEVLETGDGRMGVANKYKLRPHEIVQNACTLHPVAFIPNHNLIPSEEPVMGSGLAQHFGTAIHKASVHAERVSKREHIKADRIERVNQFITSLRRELGAVQPPGNSPASSLTSNIMGALLKKEAWYDIGQLHPSYPPSYSSVSRADLESYMRVAESLKASGDQAKSEIEFELDELERSLAGVHVIVDRANQINEESEPVAAALDKFLQ